MNLPPITLQLFAFFQWTVSISYFCSQYKEISRLSNDGKIQASVCISNPVCSLHVVVREHVYFRGKFVKKANHLANCVQVTSNSKKSDVAKFATCSEPI